MSQMRGTFATCHFARTLLVVSAFGCAFLMGCRHRDNDWAQVRVIDAISDADEILVNLPKFHQQARLEFRQGLPYVRMPTGSCRPEIATEQAGTEGRTFLTPLLTVASKRRYTAIAMGVLDGAPVPSLRLYEESPFVYPLKTSQTRVRVINAVPDAGPVDVLFDNLVIFKNLPFQRMSSPVALSAARYACTIKTAGDRYTPLGRSKPIALSGGKSYLLVALGRARDGTVSIEAYQE